MAKNSSLHAAGIAKQDEFYTQYEDIQNELNHYEKHFKNKTVLCNCDDPFESNFCKFFLRNFNYLGLKRLICTSYKTSPIAWREMTILDHLGEQAAAGNGHGYVMDIESVPMANGRGVSDTDIDKMLKSKNRGVKKLKGDGDFRSAECVEYLKQADIVVTNPPFSLFREYVAQLIEFDKKFLIIGNQNAITYKEIFPLIQQNKIWLGWKFGDMAFRVPDYYEPRKTRYWEDKKGQKWRSLGTICWYTNLDHDKRHEKLVLYRKYYGNESDYPKYDNYDAINVDKVSEIPCDYFEDVGVPITFLDKYNPNQFEIIKFRKGNDEKDLTYTVESGDNFNGTERNGTERNGTERNGTERNGTERNGEKLRLISGLSSDRKCNGIMGVPITFLGKYNPDQFEIIGATESEGKGFSAGLWDAESGIAQPVVCGERRYKRLFVKRKM